MYDLSVCEGGGRMYNVYLQLQNNNGKLLKTRYRKLKLVCVKKRILKLVNC